MTKSLQVLLLLIVFASACWGQQYVFGKLNTGKPYPPGTYYSITDSLTHGGFNLETNFGANIGDTLTLDVRCDHTGPDGSCFIKGPWLVLCPNGIQGECKSSTLFKLSKFEPEHQIYTVTAQTQGDQFVSAAYYWIGAGVHYKIHIVAKEVLH